MLVAMDEGDVHAYLVGRMKIRVPRDRESSLQRMFLLGPNRGLRNKHNKRGRLENQGAKGLPLPPSV